MSAGRRRTFDKEKVLNKAVEVFWRSGYSGTSLSDLTEAMGINKPSLYAAFGNKEDLFVSALNQYVHKHSFPHYDKLLASNTSLKKRVQRYLKSIAKMVSDPNLPSGCFIATSTCEAGSDCLPSHAFQAVTKINETTKTSFVDFLMNEQAQGNLTTNCSPEIFANYLLTLQYGLAVMARNGAKQESLEKVINHAISNF
jgi:AcrR family transcriptional regulator